MADDQRHIVVRTRCKSIDDLVAIFGRYVEGNSIFVATLDTLAQNEERSFTVVLADGTTALRGRCVVREAWATADNRFRLPGLLLGMRTLTSRTKPAFDRMRAVAGQHPTAAVPAARAPEPVGDISTRPDVNSEPPRPGARRLTLTIPPLPVKVESSAPVAESPAPAAAPPAPVAASPAPVVMPHTDDTPLPPLPATPYGLETPAVPAPPFERAKTSPWGSEDAPGNRRRRHRTTEITKQLAVVADPSGEDTDTGSPRGTVSPQGRPTARARPRAKSPTPEEIAYSRFEASRRRRGRVTSLLVALVILIAAAGYAAANEGLDAADMEPLVRAAPLPSLRSPTPRIESIPARGIIEIDGRSYTVEVVLTPVRTSSQGN